MKVVLTIILFLILSCPGYCQKEIAFVPTPINFIIKNAGVKVNGFIAGLEGFIIMDSQTERPIKIEGTIDPNTVQTGITLRDNHLKKADYFNVKEFPKMRMTSTSITKTGKGKYLGNFDLVIKDIKKNISIPFTLSAKNNVYALKGEFSINRLDFNLGEKSIILSDNVDVKLEFNTHAP
jgi:polyisoprenoid-binding protein YceI